MTSRAKGRAVKHSTVIAMTFLSCLVGGGIWLMSQAAGRAGGEAAASAISAYAERADVGACRRGNVVRADRRIDTEDPDDSGEERARVKVIFPILDCQATVRAVEAGDEPVPLAEAVQAEYIELVRQKKLPVVDNGRIVGTEEFPKALQ